jgi:Coenzyme PQQ synthesis protein D (PqqD)
VRLRNDDLEWREADGEILVLDRRVERYFSVTGAGAVLWPLLCDGSTAEGLAARLVEHYGIGERQARADVAQFVACLVSDGLLAPSDGEPV